MEDTKNSMARRNFSLAHELGHILMHSSESFDELEKDKKKQIEQEADCFAASFLLPKDAFNEDLQYPNDLDFYINLKQKWHVSILAMIMRAKDLKRINGNTYLSLIKKYSYRKYRTNEPLDNIIAIKNPVLFEQSLKLLFDKGYLTIETLLNNMAIIGLAMHLNDIIESFALDKDFFKPYQETKNIGITLKQPATEI